MTCVVLPAIDCLEDNNIACIHSKIFRSRLDIGDPTAFADCRFGCTCDLERQIIRRASRLLSLTFIPSGYLSTLPQSVFAHVISAHSRSRSAHLHVAYGPYLPRNSNHMFSLFAHAFHSCVFFCFLLSQILVYFLRSVTHVCGLIVFSLGGPLFLGGSYREFFLSAFSLSFSQFPFVCGGNVTH